MSWHRLRDWLAARPATKAAWIALILAAIVQPIALWQNSRSIRTAQEAFLLSQTPSVEFDFRNDRILIKNLSNYPLVEVEAAIIRYVVNFKEEKIVYRNTSGQRTFVPEKIAPKEEVSVAAAWLNLDETLGEPLKQNESVAWSLVLIFHRKIDRKRFVRVEAFDAPNIEGVPSFFPLKTYKTYAAGGGAPYGIIKTFQQIEWMEKALYRADEQCNKVPEAKHPFLDPKSGHFVLATSY
jgi:hypothetical protein